MQIRIYQQLGKLSTGFLSQKQSPTYMYLSLATIKSPTTKTVYGNESTGISQTKISVDSST